MTDNNRHFVESHCVDVAVEYLEAGFALVPIAPGSKGPRGKGSEGWNLRENVWEQSDLAFGAAARALVEEYEHKPTGWGLAHAYAGTMALDIDEWDLAAAWLADRGVDLQALFDAPDAVHLLSGRAGRGKLIYRMPDLTPTLTTKQPAGSGLELRCADSRGHTLQDVLPPSIHPDTGRPYYWGGAGDWRDLPLIPPELLRAWSLLVAVKPKEAAALADVGAFEGSTGVYSVPAIWNVIDKISPDSEYPLWIRVGMAIHEETSGEETGYEIFDQWSAKGTKYAGPEQTRAKWDSFQGSDRPVTLAGLVDRFEPASIDAFEDLGPKLDPAVVEPTQPGKIMFALEPGEAVDQDEEPIDYFIKGVLPRAELGVLYGASGSGKSFIMLDMALAIAAGQAWRGHRVRPARVAYVINEGKRSFRKRTRAYKMHFGIGTLPDDFFIVRNKTPHFGKNPTSRQLAADILAQGGAGLIVIDTLSQSIAGEDENNSETMSKVARLAGQLADATGAMVLFVHHSGKDEAKGQRGHSSLRAACDVELGIARDKQSDVRVLTITKSKDDADGREYGFRLKVVEIGRDTDGDAVTSCVCEEAVAEPRERDLPPTHKLVKETMDALIAPGGDTIALEAVLEVAKSSIGNEGARDTRRQRLMRAVMEMQAKGQLKLMDGQLVKGWL